MDRLIISVFLVIILASISHAELILQGPADAVYRNRVDQTAILTCLVNTTAEVSVFWLCDARFLYPNPTLTSKYNVSTSAATSGDYSMTILGLNRTDNCKYSCSILQTGESASATILVAGELLFAYYYLLCTQ